MNQKDYADKFDAMMSSWEAKLAALLLLSWRNIKSVVNTTLILRLIEQGNYSQIVEIITPELVANEIQPFIQGAVEAYVAGGKFSAMAAPSIKKPLPSGAITEVKIGFNVVNPKMASVLEQYRAEKITQITADARETIRSIIVDALTRGVNPKETALRIRDAIGLTSDQERMVMNYRVALEKAPLEALRRKLRDRRFDSTVRRAHAEGIPLKPEQIEAQVNRYRQRLLTYRATTIARTESIRLLSESNQELWRQAIEDGKVLESSLKRFWISTKDGRTRAAHRQIPLQNKDGVGMSESFKSILGPIRYPGDPSAVPGNVINCFVPETLIYNSGIKGMIQRRYSGSIIKINTANGINLSVTPNHPILTNRGWILANRIVKNDYLIQSFMSNSFSGGHPDITNGNSRADSLYRFSKVPLSIARPARGIVNLHGEIPNHDVEVVSFPGGLLHDRESFIDKGFCKLIFKFSDFMSCFLPGNSRKKSAFLTFWRMSSSFSGVSSDNQFFFCGKFRIPNFVDFSPCPYRDSHISEATINKRSGFTYFFSDFKTAILFFVKFFYFLKILFSFFIKTGLIFLGNHFITSSLFNFNAKIFKARSYKPMGYTNFLGNIINRISFVKKLINIREKNTSLFFASEIDSISHEYYDGSIYNFETDTGLILANNIITHNCRCTVFFKILD